MTDQSRWAEHWQQTMGDTSPSMEALYQALPVVEESYMAMRTWLYEARDDGLDIAMKELLMVVIDVIIGRPDGASRHAESAMNHGLTLTQLREALTQCFMVRGINTWGSAGREVWEKVGQPRAAAE